MKSGAERRHRRSIRLKRFDYRQAGAYFVTICTEDRAPLFGGVVDGDMQANDVGRMVTAEWRSLTDRFPSVQLDAFVVMPNHVHAVIVITDAEVGAGLPRPCKMSAATDAQAAILRERPTLGRVVAFFKYQTTKRINQRRATPGVPVWQRNYYEHVIRDDQSLDRIRRYIVDNPARWAFDRENPLAAAPEPEAAWRA